MAQKILQLIYTSYATKIFSSVTLLELLHKARTFNHSVNITGMLVHDDGYFLQVLEGPEAKVKELYKKIENDPRHKETKLIYEELEDKKEFENWSMGFVDISSGTMDMKGFITFANQKFENMNKAEIKDVLKSFQEGEWRQKVNH